MLQRKYIHFFIIFALIAFFLISPAYAANPLSGLSDKLSGWGLGGGKGGMDIATAFKNLIGFNIFGIAIVKWAAMAVGIFLAGFGAVKFVRYSDGKEQMMPALFTFFSGVLLVSMTSLIGAVSSTMAVDNASMSTSLITTCQLEFVNDGSCASDGSIETYLLGGLHGVITFMKLIGFFAVARGIYGFHEMGANRQGGGFFKNIIFIIGGTGCINIVSLGILFANTIANGDNQMSNYLIKLLS